MDKKVRWERAVSLGRTRYILYHGVLGWGLVTAAAFVGWSWYSKGSLAPHEVVIPFVVFPIGGFAWGAVMWRWLQKRFVRKPTDMS